MTTTFDDTGRVSGVAGYASNFGYTASGALQQFTLGSGLVEAAVFNSRMQPTSMTLTNPANGVQLFGLAQEFAASTNNGNVLGQTITAPSLSITQKYGYDSLNRLSVAAENPASGTAICPDAGGSAWCEKYSYDRYGNRWVAQTSGFLQTMITPVTQSAFAAATNQMVGSNYDAAGNQISAGGGSFAYDAENRQKSVTLLAPQSGTFSYSYDGEGFRVKRSVYGMETVHFHDVFGRVVTEYRNGNWLKDFVYLGGQLLAVEDAQGRSYVTADHLGSTRLVTEADKDVRSRHDYLPFGKEVPVDLGGRAGIPGYAISGWSPVPRAGESVLQRFTSQEVDPETGLNHFMFRYYSGRQGRFTSADPLGGDATDPQSFNAYAYGLNNPLLYIDPAGLEPACYLDGVLSSCRTVTNLINMGAAFLSPISPGMLVRGNRNKSALEFRLGGDWYTAGMGKNRFTGRDEFQIGYTTLQGWETISPELWAFLGGVGGSTRDSSSSGWWRTFAQTFFTEPYRKSEESFVSCWNRAAADTLGAVGLPEDYALAAEGAAFVSGALGLLSSIKMLKVSTFGGKAWARPSSVLAKKLGGGSRAVRYARWTGKGLAVVLAAEIGLRTGAAMDCAVAR